MSQQRLHTDIWHRARYQRILQFLLTSLLVEFTTLAASPALAGGLSASQVLALRAIAVSRPYGATILLYTLGSSRVQVKSAIGRGVQDYGRPVGKRERSRSMTVVCSKGVHW